MSKPEITVPEGMTAEEAADVIREYGSTDNPRIVSLGGVESLRENIDEVKEIFAEILAEESPQSADTLAKQDMAALVEPFTDSVGTSTVDTLHQTPETGDVDGSPSQTGGADIDSLSHSTVKELETLDRKRRTFESRGIESRVGELEEEMTDLAGVDSYEQIEL